ncbi:hypothetical protein TPY_1997 [Sulfobacillus acidophilus TPY]|nr:hypothetical protein TPY_1997 [Sulfobacillus acidophilus TPY]
MMSRLTLLTALIGPKDFDKLRIDNNGVWGDSLSIDLSSG